MSQIVEKTAISGMKFYSLQFSH